MRHRFFEAIVLASVFTTLNSTANNTEIQWAQYLHYKNLFYLLDNQSFSQISCRITSSNWMGFIQQLHQHFDRIPQLKIIETTGQARILFRRQGEMEFVKPKMDLEIISTKGLKDPKRVEASTVKLKEGFEKEVQITRDTVGGIFAFLFLPPRDTIKIKDVNLGDRPSIRYSRNGAQISESLNDSTVTYKEESAAQKVQALLAYENRSGKLLLRMAELRMELPRGTVNTQWNVLYVPVGGVEFPSVITTRHKLQGGPSETEASIDIQFTDCKKE